MKTQISIHYRKGEQCLEFHCPFCNQTQGWSTGVRVGENGEVYPDPKVAFNRHLLGDSNGMDRCFVEPTVDEIDEYGPIAMIEA